MIRVTLDTNVIVSSFLGAAGPPRQIRRAWQADRFQLCLSRLLLDEVHGTLSRPKIIRRLQVGPAEVAEFLDRVFKHAVIAREPLAVEAVIAADPDDDIVLATAVATASDLMVSGDRHLLDLQEHRGIPIVTPRAFVILLDQDQEYT